MGSDFDFDFKKPAIVSVQATNNSTVVVTFSEKMNKAAAETTGNYTIAKVVDPTNPASTNAVNSAVLAADGKTVTLNVSPAMIDAPNGYNLTFVSTASAGVTDLAGNRILAAERIFDGNGTADASKPVVASATYDTANAKINIVFSKPIAQTAGSYDKSKFSLKGSGEGQELALTSNTFANLGNNGFTVTLTAAQNTAVNAYADLKLNLAANAVTDLAATPQANEAQELAITKVAKPQVTAATYTQATRELTLTLASEVNVTKINKAQITLGKAPSTPVTLGAADTVTTTANSNTIKITLSTTNANAFAKVAAADRVVSLAANAFETVDGTLKNEAQNNFAVTYTADTAKPQIQSASLNDVSGYLILVFDKDMDQTTFNASGVTIKKDATTLLTATGATAVPTPANPKQVVLNIGGNAGLAAVINALQAGEALKVYFTAGAFRDTTLPSANVVDANTAGTALSYLDQTPPAISAVTNGVKTGLTGPAWTGINTAENATTIRIGFSEPVTTATATTLSNYAISLNDNAAVTFNPTAATMTADRKQVLLTVPSTANYAGQVIKVVVNGIKDDAGNTIATNTTGHIRAASTLVDTTPPTINAVTFVDANPANVIGQGDKIEIKFTKDIIINPAISAADFKLAVTGVTTPSFGAGATYAVKPGTTDTLVVTLGTNPQISQGVTTTGVTDENAANRLSIQIKDGGTANIKDVFGNNAAQTQAVTVERFAPAGPYVTAALYTDVNNNGVIDATDKLEITFNQNITASDTHKQGLAAGDFTISDSKTFTNATGPSSVTAISGNKVTFTLSAGTNDFVPGTTTIRYAGTTNKIYNVWNVEATAGANPVVIAGAVTAGPKLIGATFVNADKSTGTAVTEGDKIILTFSAPVQGTLVDQSLQIINDGVAEPIKIHASTADTFNVSQPFADKSKVVLTRNSTTSNTYFISTGSTMIRKALGVTTGLTDAYNNAVADAAAIAIQAEPVASSAKQPVFGATFIEAKPGVAANYISDSNKTDVDIKFSLPSAGVAGDRIYWKITDSSVPVKTITGSKDAETSTAQTIDDINVDIQFAEGNVTLTVWVVEADGKISQEVSQVIVFDKTAPGKAAAGDISAIQATPGTYAKDDTITIKFSEPVDATKITVDKMTISGEPAHTLGTGATVAPTTGVADTFTITLGNGTNVVTGDTITITAENVVDAAGNVATANVVFTLP